jgi:hypothetical protein
MELQELISLGRFIFSGAAKRLEVFRLIDGKKNTKEIAIKMGRNFEATSNDLKKLKDMGLIEQKKDNDGKIVEKDSCAVYEKVPLLRHVPLSYFHDTSRGKIKVVKKERIYKEAGKSRLSSLAVPSENEILDICKHGEDQIYEFKAPGIETSKVSKEVAAFLNTKVGGLIFYGVDDDGSIIGSDTRRQDFDQSLQNSIRNTISPQPNVEIKERDVLGHKVLVVVIPPWDRKNIYQYKMDGRVYIRKGTNIFVATPEELKKLGKGEYVV